MNNQSDDLTPEQLHQRKCFLVAVGMYCLILLLAGLVVVIITQHRKQHRQATTKVVMHDHLVDADTATTPDEWNLLIDALIQIESKGDPLVPGKTNDLGILQITPIYVADVNRILDTPMYTLEMRTDIEKSLEMFEIYQHHYNPERDISKAIKLHNPRAGKWYEQIVMNQFNKLKHEAV